MKACRGSPFVFNLFCSLAMFKIHEVDEKEGTKEGCFRLNNVSPVNLDYLEPFFVHPNKRRQNFAGKLHPHRYNI